MDCFDVLLFLAADLRSSGAGRLNASLPALNTELLELVLCLAKTFCLPAIVDIVKSLIDVLTHLD